MTTNNLIIWILISKKLKIEKLEKSSITSKMSFKNDRKWQENDWENDIQSRDIDIRVWALNKSIMTFTFTAINSRRTILDKIINVSKIPAPNLDKLNQIIAWYYMKNPSKLSFFAKYHEKITRFSITNEANKLKGLVH